MNPLLEDAALNPLLEDADSNPLPEDADSNPLPEDAAQVSHSLARTSQRRREDYETRKGIDEDSDPKQASREPTKYPNDIGEAESESAIRHRVPNTKISDRSTVQEISKDIEQPQEGSLLLDIANDIWGLIQTMDKTAPKLVRLFYSAAKCFLVGSVIGLVITYLLIPIPLFATTKMAQICSNEWVGVNVPFCESFGPSERLVNVSRVAASQEVFVTVMDQVGQNFEIARKMAGHELAVRDLRVRVRMSNLPHKEEITRELDSLIQYTTQTSK